MRNFCYIWAISSIIYFAGISETFAAKTVYQNEVATFRFTPVSVFRWDDILDDLQPKYTLTAEAARNAAIPKTAQLSEINSSKTGLSFKFGNDGLREVINKTTDFLDSSKNTDTKTITTEKAPESIGGASLPEDIVEKLSANAFSGRSYDPHLSYSAGTALFQEVKLINKYLEHAVMRDGYSPYVLRFNVTPRVMRSVSSHDVYSRISFFPSWVALDNPQAIQTKSHFFNTDCRKASKDSKSQKEVIESCPFMEIIEELINDKSITVTNNTNQGQIKTSKKITEKVANKLKRPGRQYSRPAIVMPLLVTEAAERSDVNSQRQMLRNFSLGLSDIVSGGLLGGGFENSKGKGTNRQVSDVNNTFSVSRALDGVLELRLGANYDENKVSIDTRHYAVTVMVLVPNDVLGDRENIRRKNKNKNGG